MNPKDQFLEDQKIDRYLNKKKTTQIQISEIRWKSKDSINDKMITMNNLMPINFRNQTNYKLQ